MEIRRVTGLEPLGPSGWVLSIAGPLDYIPGQHIGVTLPGGPEPRLYSIIPVDRPEHFGILFTPVPQGELTPDLLSLKPGDRILTTEVRGSFFDPPGRVWWIGAGTGIAPFYAMSRLGRNRSGAQPPGKGDTVSKQPPDGNQHTGDGYRAATPRDGWFASDQSRKAGYGTVSDSPERLLLHSARQEQDLYFRDYFTNAPGIRYCPFSTRERPGPGVRHQRITTWIDQTEDEVFQRVDAVLLCGSTQMILDLRELLMAKGLAYDRIFSEIYF
ncbi:ferredoxin reductase domain-containing protein [Spirochaeta lutea]|uniref:FAD-binding FR-type domain-containing protein n=1 Tax=Spirochaeta lutea TaxID=1480694 RepID=A0A098QYA1_9SPIO|nr:hypothetical protein [Spirochaeta lutea]KGE72820.1 hypothetical protein DC28_05450 [Spirochaeta lutea]